MNNMIKSKWSV